MAPISKRIVDIKLKNSRLASNLIQWMIQIEDNSKLTKQIKEG